MVVNLVVAQARALAVAQAQVPVVPEVTLLKVETPVGVETMEAETMEVGAEMIN